MSPMLRVSIAGFLLAAATPSFAAVPVRPASPPGSWSPPSNLSSTPSTVLSVPGATAPDGFRLSAPLGLGFPLLPIAVAVAGDVDGNGASDWLVGTPYFSPNLVDVGVGRVTIYMRDANGVFDERTIDGPGENSNFGASVAPAGDVNGDGYDDIVVGAPGIDGTTGRVYIYKGSPSGLLTQAPWTIDGTPFSSLGFDVAHAGDVNGDGYDDILVGAPGFSGTNTGQGAVYCYLGGPLGPAALPVRTWTGGSDFEYLGWGVAGGGDVNADGYTDVLVGSPGYSNGQSEEGRVQLFLGGAGGPAAGSAWDFESNADFDQTGKVVAFPGDMDGDGYGEFALGIPNAGLTDDGRLLIFGGTPFVFFAPLVYEDSGPNVGAQFGFDVAPAGDLNGDGLADLVAGAPFAGASQEGLWYSLYGSPDMGLIGSYIPESGPPGWSAGIAVSGGGDRGDGVGDLLIGVYVPTLKAGESAPPSLALGLPEGPGMIPTQGMTFDQFGYFSSHTFAQGDFDEPQFGTSALLMDINGDGYDDVIVGGSQYSGDFDGQGIARAYFGAADGLGGDPFVVARKGGQGELAGGIPPQFTAPDWFFPGPTEGSNFAFSLANAGDVNGDGYEDLLVGAPTATYGFGAEGAAYLFYGGPDGPGTQPDWHSEGLEEFAFHGYNVAGAGDVNQDGYADFLIGTPLASPGGIPQAGKVQLHYGSSIGPSHVPVRVWTGANVSANMGTGSCGAGDVDNDGYPDVLINEPGYSGPEENEGRVRIYRGGAAGVAPTPFFTYETDVAFQYAGFTCAPAGDVNCDGYADVLVGSYEYTDTQPNDGAVQVFTGGPAGMNLVATLSSGVSGSGYGISVSTAGDVNKDGCSDFLVGAPDQAAPIFARSTLGSDGTAPGPARTAAERLLAPGPTTAGDGPADGVAYLYYGDPGGILAQGSWLFSFPPGNAGRAVAGGGDVNGDGWPDFVYTSPYGDGIKTLDNGLATIAFTNIVTTGVPRPERLLRTDASAPIAHGGRSNSNTAFRVAGLGRHPMGRGRARMQWQAKAPGAALDGTGIQSSSVLRTGVPTPELGSTANYGGLASGLATGERYRVRVRYATRNPYVPRTRWITSERNGLLQSDLRAFGPTGAVAVEDPVIAGALSFAGPWPNPLATSGTLSFSLPAAGRVTIDAYDAGGRRVARVLEGDAAAGPSTVTWDGRDDAGRALPRGMYFLRLTSAAGEKTVKAVLAR